MKKTYKKSTKKFTFKNPLLIAVIILVVAIGVFLIIRSFAANVVGSIQGEALTTGQGVTAVSDSLAGGMQAMKFSSNTVASGTVSLSGASNQIVVRAKGDQCNGAPNMVVSVDGKQLVNANVSGTSWGDYTVNLSSALAQGSHSVSVQMTNPYTGYRGKSRNVACTRALYIDVIQFTDSTIPNPTPDSIPVTSITNPANGAPVSSTVAVTALATDNVGVTKVELYIDGKIYGSPVTATPYNWSWDTTQTTNASHTLYTKAYDAAGNVGTSATVSVTVNNTTTTITNCDNKALPSGVPALNMTFCDDFSGSSVSTTNWEDCNWSQSDACHGNKLTNNQLEWNRLANCTVNNGNLNLNAIRGNYTSAAGYTYPWTSCLLATKSLRLQYGYIEEKSVFPSAKGFWPAFWTYQPPGAYYNVETDVYEYYSDNKSKLYLTQQQGGGGCVLNLGFDPTSGFHTYGAYIAPSGTTWYIDGKQVCSTPNTSTNLGAVITNLAVFATIPPDSATNQATKQVDYIKVWQ